MPKVSEIREPYFSHDYSTRESREIKLIIEDYGFEGYGLWWAIVEFLHRNQLKVGEERLVCGKAHEVRVKKILNDYNLFRVEDGFYVSDRILRNINEQEEKADKARIAVNTRWLLSAYKKYYKEIFNVDVVLSDDEIRKLKEYENKIEYFKKELPDILFTLSKIQFDNGITTKARSNWLLADNNLAKIHNGQYGPLRSWKQEKEARKPKPPKEEAEELPTFDSKAKAVEYIKSSAPNTKFLSPIHKQLMKQFDITVKELDSG